MPQEVIVLPIVALIADRDPQDRRELRRRLDALPAVKVVAECGAGCKAVEAIRAHHPDLVFLLVDLPDIDGFEVLGRCDRSELPVIVFVANQEARASDAFAVRALDYLVKPVAPGRLRNTVERARVEIQRRRAMALLTRMRSALQSLELEPPVFGAFPPGSPVEVSSFAATRTESVPPSEGTGNGGPTTYEADASPDRLLVKRAGRVIFVDPEEIDWVEAVGCYARLHLGDQHLLHRTSMQVLEKMLDDTVYFRIHRSYIVRLDRIREVRPCPKGGHEYVVALEGGVKLPLSRRRRAELMRSLSASN